MQLCASPKPGMFGSVRCRKCKPCLALRQADWVSRAVWEFLAADHGWFVTLTFRFKPKEDEAYAEFQKYVKRLRKVEGKGRSFRYLCCSEFGERNGRYHLHALVLVHGPNVVGRLLRNRWKGGFTHARKLKARHAPRVARYVGKYLAKVGRIRASTGFGNQTEKVNQNVLGTHQIGLAILEAFPGAKVVAVKEDGSPRVRAPYHLRRPARLGYYSGGSVQYGRVRRGSDDLYPARWIYWGPLSPLPDTSYSSQAEED